MADVELLRFCAKYPFAKEAKEQLKEINLNEVAYDTAEQAFNYIDGLAKMDAAALRAKLTDINNSGEAFLKKEIALFPVSKIISSLAETSAKRGYAKAEAKKAHYFLQFEKDVRKIAKNFLKLDGNRIHVSEFLRLAGNDEALKLVNFELREGYVSVDNDALGELVSQYVFRNVMDAKIDKKDVPKVFIFFADELRKKKGALQFDSMEFRDFGGSDIAFFPPCVKKIISDLKSGEKVAHIPRFVLSTFFANANVPVDAAIGFFKNQPNFDEKKTRYYLEHSYGTKGGTKYSVPACGKVHSYGICCRDNSCSWRHPLEYYAKTKAAAKAKSKPAKPATDVADAGTAGKPAADAAGKPANLRGDYAGKPTADAVGEGKQKEAGQMEVKK